MQASETVNQNVTEVVKAADQLRAIGMAQYDKRIVTRGKYKGREDISQSPIQRATQQHVYQELAIMEARFISDRLGLHLEEIERSFSGGKYIVFRMSKYPGYMGDLDKASIDQIFAYLTNSWIMAGENISREERAGRMAATFSHHAVWQMGGDIHINPEALVA